MDKTIRAYRKIRRLPLRYVPYVVLAFLSINVLSLALPLTMKKIYGTIIQSKSVTSLRYILLFVVSALILESILRATKDSTCRWISSKYEFLLVKHMLKNILKSDDEMADSCYYISNTERIRSVAKVSSFYAVAYYQAFIDVPFAALFLYLIYVYGGILFYIPLITGGLYVAVNLVFSFFLFEKQSDYIDRTDDLMGILMESLEKIHIIKSSGTEEAHINRYKDALKESTELEYERNRYQIIPTILASNIGQLTMFLILICGGYLMSLNTLSFAQITACAILGSRAVGPIVSVMRVFMDRREVSIYEERIQRLSLLDSRYSEDIPIFPEDVKGTIEFAGFAYIDSYTDRKRVLNHHIPFGSFLHISPDEFRAYDQMFDAITGRKSVKEGRVLIDNLDINEWNAIGLRGQVDRLDTRPVIFKGTVMENLTYYDNTLIKSAYDSAALTGLDELVKEMNEGYSTQLDHSSVNYLSSSFIQRMNLSRVFLIRPRILLIDRIDEAMDRETLDTFIWVLSKLKGTATILAATNNQEIIQLCDQEMAPGLDIRKTLLEGVAYE